MPCASAPGGRAPRSCRARTARGRRRWRQRPPRTRRTRHNGLGGGRPCSSTGDVALCWPPVAAITQRCHAQCVAHSNSSQCMLYGDIPITLEQDRIFAWFLKKGDVHKSRRGHLDSNSSQCAMLISPILDRIGVRRSQRVVCARRRDGSRRVTQSSNLRRIARTAVRVRLTTEGAGVNLCCMRGVTCIGSRR